MLVLAKVQYYSNEWKNIIINNNYVASAETQVKSFPQSSTIQSNSNFHTSAANWLRGNSGNSSVWCETEQGLLLHGGCVGGTEQPEGSSCLAWKEDQQHAAV